MDDVKWQRGANPFFTSRNRAVNHVKGKRERIEDKNEPAAERDPYAVPQMEKGYPEPSSHGILPAYGLFVSNAKNVKIDNVEFETIKEDKRPAIVLMNVEDIKFSDMKADKSAEAPYFVLKGVKGFEVKGFQGIKDRKIASAEDLEIRK